MQRPNVMLKSIFTNFLQEAKHHDPFLIHSGEALIGDIASKRQSEPVVSSAMSLKIEVRDRGVKVTKPGGMLKLATTKENLDRLLDPRELYVLRGDQSHRDRKMPKAATHQTVSEAQLKPITARKGKLLPKLTHRSQST